MANQLAQLEKCGPVALAHIKQLILTLENKHADYSHQLLAGLMSATQDCQQATRAFAEKSRRELPTINKEIVCVSYQPPRHWRRKFRTAQPFAISGNGGGMVEADHILAAIEARFLQTGHPRDLTLIHSLGIGDRDSKGTNRFAHAEMLKRIIAGHFTWSPKMQELVKSNAIEAYCFPGGVIQALLREIGAGRPGLFTHVGLGSFVDPRNGGGKSNECTTDDLVELIEIDGETKLRYRPFKGGLRDFARHLCRSAWQR